MRISCILLATAKRLNWLDLSVKSIDSLDFKFNEKILSIDEFDGYKISEDTILEYEKNGWRVDLVSLKNKHLSLKRVIDLCFGDYIFYTEDDIIIKEIPIEIVNILPLKINGRECGLLSMNLGGSLLDYPNHMGDLPYWMDNTIFESENTICFTRLETKKSNWFFEFPCLFVNNQVIKNILNNPTISNHQIESELTNRYFTNRLNEKYFKASICYKKIKNTINLLLSDNNVSYWIEELEKNKLYRILDPNQGGANIDLDKINNV